MSEGIIKQDLTELINAQNAIWMAALGFTLLTGMSGVAGGKLWRNEELRISILVSKPLDYASIVRQVLYATTRKQEQASQLALREALLPAMGLTMRNITQYKDGYDETMASDVVQLD